MKKFLIVILSFMLIPSVVLAEECETTDEPWCTGESCLTSLQRNYNLWSTSGNNGKSCIKVIAKRNGNTKSYLSEKDPERNYFCSNGNNATSELVYSALPDSEQNVTECQNDTCYIPEVWLMDCGTTSLNGNNGDDLGSSNGNVSNDDNINDNDNTFNDEDITTNEDGQITGTTDASDTGVETYFIVLFIMSIISYMILIVSKKKNLFKNI